MSLWTTTPVENHWCWVVKLGLLHSAGAPPPAHTHAQHWGSTKCDGRRVACLCDGSQLVLFELQWVWCKIVGVMDGSTKTMVQKKNSGLQALVAQQIWGHLNRTRSVRFSKTGGI